MLVYSKVTEMHKASNLEIIKMSKKQFSILSSVQGSWKSTKVTCSVKWKSILLWKSSVLVAALLLLLSVVSQRAHFGIKITDLVPDSL